MSTMESKLEAWLRYVAKQEEAIKHPDEAATPEPQQMAAAAVPVIPATPAAPAAASPASTPTLASTPTVTATIERQLRHTAPPEPEIPEVEDFLPIVRRRTEPPAYEQPQMATPAQPIIERKPEPIQTVTPPPAPVAPVAPRAVMPPAPTPAAVPAPPKPAESTLFMPQAPAPPRPVQAPQPARAPQPAAPAAPAKPRVKTVTPPASMQAEGAQEMWDRLPRHVQLLVGTHPKEIAQPSYKEFKESRDQLIERLLDPTLSLEEAARILNVCPTTVRRYTNKNQLKHLRTAGNQRRFRLSDILAFMEAQASKRSE
jgi:excisionase family DNA binding protein